jgi:hypothetical protein
MALENQARRIDRRYPSGCDNIPVRRTQQTEIAAIDP